MTQIAKQINALKIAATVLLNLFIPTLPMLSEIRGLVIKIAGRGAEFEKICALTGLRLSHSKLPTWGGFQISAMIRATSRHQRSIVELRI